MGILKNIIRIIWHIFIDQEKPLLKIKINLIMWQIQY